MPSTSACTACARPGASCAGKGTPSAATVGFGCGRHHPALVEHTIDQESSPEWVESRRTMRHESLLTVWSFNPPYRDWRLSFVNNVPGDDN